MVGVEEHAWTAELRDALLKDGTDDTVRMIADGWPAADEQLRDVGDRRLERMDASGIDVAVLSISAPGTQPLKPSEAVPLARDANDFLAGAVSAHPDRYGAFATLPISDPEAAVQEFERCVTQLGMVGAMLFPRTGDRYLDHETFRAIFEVADTFEVPIYLHPQFPPRAVRDVHFSGFGTKVDTLLASGGWGWHAEVGIAALRLILAGTFDRHPNLQLVLGHWGEMLVPFVERANVLSTPAGLDRSVAECVTGNVLVTAGGFGIVACVT
jgi:predicted TIM-barrel fold metal-dependent hydrolase